VFIIEWRRGKKSYKTKVKLQKTFRFSKFHFFFLRDRLFYFKTRSIKSIFQLKQSYNPFTIRISTCLKVTSICQTNCKKNNVVSLYDFTGWEFSMKFMLQFDIIDKNIDRTRLQDITL
jgi:hypothetical protein